MQSNRQSDELGRRAQSNALQLLAEAGARMGEFDSFDIITDGASCVTAFERHAGGFSVGLLLINQCWIVTAGDWFQEFQCSDAALALLTDALSGLVRLRVDCRDCEPWRWTIERHTPRLGWVEAGRSRQKTVPRTGRAWTTTHLQNSCEPQA